MTAAEFDRVMHAYWHSLEGMEYMRRVSFYIAKADELMAAWQPWNCGDLFSRRPSSHEVAAAPYPFKKEAKNAHGAAGALHTYASAARCMKTEITRTSR